MIEVIAFKKEHLKEFVHYPGHEHLVGSITEAGLDALEKSINSGTVLDERGTILCCAGVLKYWENRGEAWTFLHKDCRSNFLSIFREVQRALEACPLKRIESIIDLDFDEGHRWIQMLGFELECSRMRSYKSDGKDASLYVRLK